MFLPSVPPVISVSHPKEGEEELEVDVEEQGDKEESRQSGEEATTSVEDTKQEVRDNLKMEGLYFHKGKGYFPSPINEITN